MALSVAVIGAGRAGQARARALEAHPDARLAAVVRRAPAAGELSFSQVIEDGAVDALIVCTPNLLHPAAARAGLAAGKHVAVEFPLAPRSRSASELFELARTSRRVLHVEHIELLSPSQLALRESASKLGRPIGGSLRFSGGSEGWIGEPALAGSPALRSVARLHRLVDLFGEAEVRTASVYPGASGGYVLEAELAFAAGGELLLVEERAPGLERRTDWNVVCERGELGNPGSEPPGELFRADLDHFLARIAGTAEPYVSESRILHVLQLVEAIDAADAKRS